MFRECPKKKRLKNYLNFSNIIEKPKNIKIKLINS